MMIETPIEILQKKLDYYNRLKIKLETKDGISPMNDIIDKQFLDNLNALVHRINLEINIYNKAIAVLKKTGLK
ncbi:MAG: hypothetical protein IT265_07160 [Saprospiraceae bacterium]|nr:hypothetical protein [Saprospiraceae bacterium]